MIREHYPQQWINFPLISYKDTCFHTARTPLYLLQTAVADADLTVKKLSFTGESANQKAAYKTIVIVIDMRLRLTLCDASVVGLPHRVTPTRFF